MPEPGTAARREPRRSALVVFAACVLSVLLFHSPRESGADGASPPAATDSAPARPAHPAPDRLAAPVVDDDGVQRQLAVGGDPAVALTFDDGPDPRWTPLVLDLLRRHHARATFCLVGRYVAAHPELVRRIAAEGHALCNHTWAHDEVLTRRPPDTIRADLRRTSDAIVAASGGRAPAYFRAPAGRWGPAVVAEAGRLGLRSLGWSVDPVDWRRPPAEEIARRVLTGTTAGAIVLLHDGYGRRSATVAALETILTALEERRLAFAMP